MRAQLVCPHPNCRHPLILSVTPFLNAPLQCSRCGRFFHTAAEPQGSPGTLLLPAGPDEPVALTGTLPLPTPACSLPPQRSDDPSLPSCVDRFQVRRFLGEGTFGRVYEAYDPQLDRLVALKVAKPEQLADASRVRGFLEEARAAANLRHPSIVPVYDSGQDQGQYYIASAFIEGQTLAARLEELTEGWLPLREAAGVVRRLADALAYAHTEGIIHRDVKPANVMLDRKGEPLLADFGLAARSVGGESSQDKQVVGTPEYMAPEQGHGEAVAASDQYSLGCTLYQLLTGQLPFVGGTPVHTLFLHASQPVLPLQHFRPDVPLDLQAICLKCLEKDPTRRYGGCTDLADDLRRWLDGELVRARSPGTAERLLRWARRAPFQAAALAAGSACVVLLVATLFLQARNAQQKADLSAREAELRTRELEESQRREEVGNRFAGLFAGAERAAAEARRADAAAWESVVRTLHSALELADGDPAVFMQSPLRPAARRLLDRAEGALADARLRDAERARLVRLTELHGDAVFFATLATGLGLEDNLERARRAAAEGLALFAVTTDGDGPPKVKPGFFDPEEVRLLTSRCYELLLIDAETLARPLAGEKVGVFRDRLREALRRLDRADRLQAGLRTHSGLRRRAEYLAALAQPDEARLIEAEARQTAPVLAADHFLIGMEHYRRDEFGQAVPSLAAALRAESTHYGAQYLLALCQLRQKQFQEARVGLSRCLTQRPDFAWPRLLRATAEMELARLGQGSYATAGGDLNVVLENPPDPSAHYVALTNRGVLAMYRRDWQGAIADFRTAIEQKPDALPAYINLALAHRQRAGEIPWQHGTLVLAPNGIYSLLAVQNAHQQQALAEAVTVLSQAIERRPDVSRLYHERGRLRLLSDDADRAREDFARAVLLAPNLGTVSTLADDLLELGRLLHEKREYAAAAKTCAAVLQIPPTPALSERRALAARRLAEPLLALRRWKEAGAALDLYLELTPVVAGVRLPAEQARRLADALKARGLIHAEQKDWRAAVESYTQGLRLVRDPGTLSLRGWLFLMSGATNLALSDFNEAVQSGPGEADPLIGRADARVKLGHVHEALADLRQGLRQIPESERPEARRRLLYNGARVSAQAAARLTEDGPASRSAQRTAAECAAEAVTLLRQALVLVPVAERSTFWREYVQGDAAFAALRGKPALLTLAAAFGGR